MYMFSVFYALPEALQKESLYQLASIAQDGAMLAICDYVRLDEDLEEFYDFAGKPMKPPLLGDLKKWLDEAGWALVEDVNLSDKYIQWYREFLEKLSNQKEALLIDFTEKTVHQVTTIFQAILNKVETKVWGGSILYARKRMFFSREPEDASVAGLNESEDCHFKSGCR